MNISRIVCWLSSCCILFNFCLQSADRLEMRMFKAGQANAIGLKIGNKALFVDIGGKIEGSVLYKVQDFIKDTTENTVIITHQHGDHFNKLQDVFQSYKINKLVVGGNVGTTHFNDSLRGINIGETYFAEVSGTSTDKLSAMLSDVLPGVKVSCLLPRKSLGTLEKHPHNQNLIVKISYNNTSIILPGDANGSMIEEVESNNKGCFSNIDILAWPHHGSMNNGETLLYQITYSSQRSPCLTVVSSDSDHDERDRLPSLAVAAFDFSPIKVGASEQYYTPGEYSWADKHCFKACHKKTDMSSKSILLDSKPLFITSNADSSYYKINIFANGFIVLYDGDEIGSPKFFGFGSWVPETQRAEILSNEIRLRFLDIRKNQYFIAICDVLRHMFERRLFLGPGTILEPLSTPSATFSFPTYPSAPSSSFSSSSSVTLQQPQTIMPLPRLWLSELTSLQIMKKIEALRFITEATHLFGDDVVLSRSTFSTSTSTSTSSSSSSSTSSSFTTTMAQPLHSFDEKWANFLLLNGFLTTDIVPSGNIANLLLTYLPIQKDEKELKKKKILIIYIFKDMFEKTGTAETERYIIRENMEGRHLHEKLELDDSLFLSWAEKKVIGSMKIFDPYRPKDEDTEEEKRE